MNLLLVSATENEAGPLMKAMGKAEQSSLLKCYHYKGHKVDILITGAGMVATAYHLAKLIPGKYDLVINAGICGSFNSNLDIGAVVNVYEDQFSEMGAEDDADFLTLEDLKLEGITKIRNPETSFSVIENVPKVNGITVNTVHGNHASIEKIVKRLHPLVESMEGAACMFVCKMERVPCVQIRAVSNYVEKRNREKWNISLAIKNLNDKLIGILNDL